MQSIRGGAVVADKRLGLPGGPSGAHLIPAPGIPRTTGGPAPPFRAGSIVSGFPRYLATFSEPLYTRCNYPIFCPSNPLALYVLRVSNISSQYFRYQTPGGASGSSVVTTSLATQPALSLTRQTVSSQPPPHGYVGSEAI